MLFSKYLQRLGHPNAEKIGKLKAKCPRLKWQTDLNDIDCGIFLMRHMESFKGGFISKYDSGLLVESEDQIRQLIKLRKKYATKILMCDLNMNQSAVMQESNAFAKFPPEMKKKKLLDAFNGRIDRLKSI